VSDEDRCWENRSVEKLHEELRGYNGPVAVMSGVLKNADVTLRALIWIGGQAVGMLPS